jgi:hypothetical protein
MVKKQKGGNIQFREDRVPPTCDNEQHITGLEEGDEFPDITGDCVYIYDNDISDEDIPKLPVTVKYLYLADFYLDELPNNQFPGLTELHLCQNSGSINFPKNLTHLTLDGDKSWQELPNDLVSLKVINCYNVYIDSDDLPSKLRYLQFSDNRYSEDIDFEDKINGEDMYENIKEYKIKNPTCRIDFESGRFKDKTKIIDMNKRAYNIMELEEFEITQFLTDNKNYIVGKCYNELVFIDRAQLNLGNSANLFKLSNLGFSINNSYIDNKYIQQILRSKHKFWLFERIYGIGHNKTIFTLSKLKDANSIIGNFFRKYSKTLKKKSPNSSTRKKSKSKSKSK